MECTVLSAQNFENRKVVRNVTTRRQHHCVPPSIKRNRKDSRSSTFRFITEITLDSEDEGEDTDRQTLSPGDGCGWSICDDSICDDSDPGTPTPSQLCYTGACKMMKITPIKYFFDNLRNNEINMKNHLLGYHGARACAIALAKNSSVEVLMLESNKLGGRGAACLAQTLGENGFITDMTLADNMLGAFGAKSVCEALCKNNIIRRLNLSGNGFKEKDALYFRQLLEENQSLRELNVSHNEFRETGGEIIAEGLCYNDSLQKLDISWNHLRLKGAIAIGKCLEENSGLQYLNVAWNGFHNEGLAALGASLAGNKTLTTLDLTCNRISEHSLPPLVDALEKNNTLLCLRLGYNSLGMDGSMSIIQVIESGASNIRYLDLGMQCVYTEFVDSEKRIASRRPFKTTHGVVLSPSATYDGEDERDSRLFEGDNPVLVLMEFMRLQNLRLVDLFSTLDKNSDREVTHDEIRSRLLETNVPLSDASIDRLIAKLDANNSGTVDFGEMFNGQKEHKRLVQKLTSKKEVAWEDTSVGKISIKMQHVMDKRLIMRSKERAAAERYQREDEERRIRLKRRQEEIERFKREAAEQQKLLNRTNPEQVQ